MPRKSCSSSAAFSNGIQLAKRTRHSCPCGVRIPGTNPKASSRGKNPLPTLRANPILAHQFHFLTTAGLQLALLLALLLQRLPAGGTDHRLTAGFPFGLGSTDGRIG